MFIDLFPNRANQLIMVFLLANLHVSFVSISINFMPK